MEKRKELGIQPPQKEEPGFLEQAGEAAMDIARPVVEPFLAGSQTENPLVRGAAEGVLINLPNSVSNLVNDIEQIIGTVEPGTQAAQIPDFIGESKQYPEAQKIAAALSQFMAPFAAAGGMKGGLLSLETFEAGALADFLFDPQEGNLSTLARQLGFDNALTQFLDSKTPEEEQTAYTNLQGRVKNALEGTIASGLVDGVLTLAGKAKDYVKYVARTEDFGTETPIRFEQPVTMNTIRIDTGIRKLDKAIEQREMGLITGDQVADLAADIADKRKLRKEIKRFMDEGTDTPKRRGADWAIARLREGVAKQEIVPEEADMAEWFIRKNPNLADDLAISIRKQGENLEGTASGMYNRVNRIASLFKDSDPGEKFSGKVAVHEILHHTERMMPEGLNQKISDLWKKRLNQELEAAWDSGNKERYEALLEQIKSQFDTDWGQAARIKVNEAKKAGHLTRDDYQFINASEFWTENATEIFAGKYGREGWLGKVKQYFKEALEYMKDRFGLDNDNAIYQGARKVIEGKHIQEGSQIAKGPELKDVYSEAGAFLNGN